MIERGQGDDAWGIARCGRLAYLEERLGLDAPRPTPKQRVRRALLYVFLTWAVPGALSAVPVGGPLAMSFASDLEAHVRGLIAVPLLVLAEWPIETRLRAVMIQLASPPLTRGRGKAIVRERVRWARRVAGHRLAEGALIALAFGLGYGWLERHDVGIATWIWIERGGAGTLTAAGAWTGGVAVPIYAFLLLRWFWRWVVLGLLFTRIATSRLMLVPNHGDRAGGLAFLSETSLVFAWVLMALSSVACAKWMDAILYAGASPRRFLPIIQGSAVIGVMCAFLPLVAFAPLLTRTKWRALRRYGGIVARHGIVVEKHWVAPNSLVVSEDASSMADLNSVYDAVRGMRLLPIRPMHVVAVAAAVVVPTLPVIALILPVRDIVAAVLKSLI